MELSVSPPDPSDYVVEWQIPEQSGGFIDLATDRPEVEVEVLLLEEQSTTSA
jgi:hypothetical protein